MIVDKLVNRYQKRKIEERDAVLFLAGMCHVLAAQAERRRRRIARLLLVACYSIFALELNAFAGDLEQGNWFAAMLALFVAYCCAAGIAEGDRA